MSYTFNSGRGHVTTYRGSCWAYVRRNLFGYWRTVTPDRATHVISADDLRVRPYTPAEASWF